VGIFIGETQHQSQGYGQQALRLILRHAFHDLGLHRLYLTVLDDNARAIRVYEKCGFRVEGRLRQHAYKRGQFRDLVLMGICAGDPEGGRDG
jgi:diamine N-acetyltransferase